MEKEARLFSTKNQLYPRELYVLIGPPNKCQEYAINNLKDKDGDYLQISNDDVANSYALTYSGICANDDASWKGPLIVANPDDGADDHIIHECVHAAGNIFDDIGAPITSGEPFAYLVEWVYNCVKEAIKQYKDNEHS